MPSGAPVTQEYPKIGNCSCASEAARQEGPWMKLRSVLLGAFFRLAAQSAGPPGRIGQLAKIARPQSGSSGLGIGYTCH